MSKFQEIKTGDIVGGFECLEIRGIPEINNVAYIFEHQKTLPPSFNRIKSESKPRCYIRMLYLLSI